MTFLNFDFPVDDIDFSKAKETLLKACDLVHHNYRFQHLICFILILKKEGFLKDYSPDGDYYPDPFLDIIIEIVEILKCEEESHLRILLDYHNRLELDLKELSAADTFEILSIIDSLDDKYLKDNCGLLFEFLLKHIHDGVDKRGNEGSQPIELTQLAMTFCPNGRVRVYNPFSGFTSAALFLPKDVYLYGQEANVPTREFAALRLMAHGKLDKVHLQVPPNSLTDWLDPSVYHYQFIVSTPPFGMRINKNLDIQTSQKTVDSYCLEKCLSSLPMCPGKAKAVITVPLGVLFRGGQDKPLREKLIKSDLLESIILLPSSLFTNTSIPVALVVLNREKNTLGHVKMVDASNCFKELSAKKRKLDVNSVTELLETESAISKLVTADDIKSNDFDLSVKRYLLDYSFEEKGDKVVKLGEIISFLKLPFTKSAEKAKGSFVSIKHLASDPFNHKKTFEDLGVTEIRRGMQKASESCLLLLLVHKPLRPTYYESTSASVYISRDIAACSVNQELVDLEYLIHELSKDYIQKQIESFAIGTAMMRISRKDLLNLKVKLPTLIEQKAMVKGLKQGHVNLKLEEAKQTAKDLEVDGKVFDQLASLKHSMGKPLLNLNSSIKIISKAILRISDSGEQVTLESKVSNRLNLSIRDTFGNMTSDLKLISNLLENSENEFDPSTYDLASIEMCKTLENFLQKVQSSHPHFKISLTFSDLITAELKKKVFIKANEDLLYILFNNIVDNAIRHGFINIQKESYHLKIDANINDEKNLKILFSNNGEPFPINFDRSKFIRKHVKSETTGNTGIGGSDIKNIIDHLEGKFDLDLNNPNEDFATIYVITLPIEAAE